MLGFARWLVLILLVAGSAHGVAAQGYTAGAGEIRFDGTLVSYDEAQKKLVMNVVSFTLPSGKSSRLAEPKPKMILLTPQTKSEIFGSRETRLAAVMQAGVVVAVIGPDSGSGKDVPARLVLVQAAPVAAAPAAPNTDPNEVALRAGETRFDARVTGILSPTHITVSVFGASNAAGEMVELFPAQTKTLVLSENTPFRSRGDAARKMAFGDLQISTRITIAGVDGGVNIKTREIAIWEADTSSSESVGSVRISHAVSALLERAEQAAATRAYEEAVRTLNRALQTAEGSGDRGGRGLTLDRLGNVYSEMNQPQKALAALQGALAVWRGMNDVQSESTTLNNLGILLGKMGQGDKAVEALERAVQLGRGGDPRGMSLTLQNLSGAYAEVKKYDKSLAAALEALPFVRQVKKDADSEALLLAHITQMYGAVKNVPKALEYATLAAGLLDRMKEKSNRAYVLAIAGETFQQAGQKPGALEFYRQAQALFTELGQQENARRIAEAIASLQ